MTAPYTFAKFRCCGLPSDELAVLTDPFIEAPSILVTIN
jgi:hypothetical protein